MKPYVLTLVLFIFLVAPLQANQDGMIVREAPVYADASSLSRQVGKFRAGSRVSIFGRKGGWKEVYSDEKSILGWVRGYQVREGSYTQQVKQETQQDSRGFLAGLASFSRKASRFFSSKSSSTSSGTATIGVRGLSEAELKSAQPDFDELAKMQQYSSDSSRLDKFVLKGQLSANEVAHIKSKQTKNSSSADTTAGK